MFRGTVFCPSACPTMVVHHMPCLLVCPVGKLQVMFRGTVFCPTMVVLAPHALFIGVCPVGKLQVMFRGIGFMPYHGSAYTTCLVYWCVR